METIRLRFTEVLNLASGNQTKPQTMIPGDDDSAYGSQSSPEDSPTIRSDSPSPTGDHSPTLPATNNITFPSPPPSLFRSRSVSESGNGCSPLKGKMYLCNLLLMHSVYLCLIRVGPLRIFITMQIGEWICFEAGCLS